jgi:hypothetical protein
MPEEIMRVVWEEGTKLSDSRNDPGANSPLVRDDDNNLVGQVTLHKIDEPKEEDESESDTDPWDGSEDDDWVPDEDVAIVAIAGALAIIAIVAAATKAAPHVKRWWMNKAVPFLKKTKSKVRKKRKPVEQVTVVEWSTLAQFAPVESSQDVMTALSEYKTKMSSVEARDRFVAALVARLFSDEQMRILRSAQIEDDGTGLELARAMEEITPEKLTESITMMLEANPSWPDENTIGELGRILGSATTFDGEPAALERVRVTGTPRQLPRGN